MRGQSERCNLFGGQPADRPEGRGEGRRLRFCRLQSVRGLYVVCRVLITDYSHSRLITVGVFLFYFLRLRYCLFFVSYLFLMSSSYRSRLTNDMLRQVCFYASTALFLACTSLETSFLICLCRWLF